MQVRERFSTKGYVIYYGAVHDDTINVWRSIARQTDGWFEEEVNDMTEEQVRVKAAVPGQDAHDHLPTVVTEIDDTRGIDDPSCIVWNCTFEGTPLSLRRHLNRYHGISFQRTARHLEPLPLLPPLLPPLLLVVVAVRQPVNKMSAF
ncbi:hypothetical protein PR001_g23104 [Phytophthora rubi]|uniref:Uncharacterized protein n=1 Tax=Phytophthora rubi TaxID=129364 RepID=A0A6A3IZ46_9STRA|nr:hypothetical protein PR001_g23104 [Phytophthora rubi]